VLLNAPLLKADDVLLTLDLRNDLPLAPVVGFWWLYARKVETYTARRVLVSLEILGLLVRRLS
jgi:hypothetical protein